MRYQRRVAVTCDPLLPGYLFDLPWLSTDFELAFDQPVIILVGENGAGNSTLIEAIAALAIDPEEFVASVIASDLDSLV